MEKGFRLAMASMVLSGIGFVLLRFGIFIGIFPAILASIFAIVVLCQKKHEKSMDEIADMAIIGLIASLIEISVLTFLLIVDMSGLDEDVLEIIEILYMLFVLTAFLVAWGVYNFKTIYPIRYGKNHIELEGRVIGEDRVWGRGGWKRCPVMEFYYQDKRYEIADETYIVFYEFVVGDYMTVCFNPDFNENVIIIKRGTFDFQTMTWLYTFSLALICIVVVVAKIIQLYF